VEQRSQEEIDHAEWENPANWRYGLFYHSERDSRPWVPKRSMYGRRRYGGTPNFAKPSARQHLMVIVGILLLFLLVVASLERLGMLPGMR
jgi:uncharacterized membrane protein